MENLLDLRPHGIAMDKSHIGLWRTPLTVHQIGSRARNSSNLVNVSCNSITCSSLNTVFKSDQIRFFQYQQLAVDVDLPPEMLSVIYNKGSYYSVE